MPNPAPPNERFRPLLIAPAVVVAAMWSAGCVAHAGPQDHQEREASAISADADSIALRSESGQTLVLSTARNGVWNAVLERGGERLVASSSTCPGLASAMDAFRILPPIKPGPYALQPAPNVRPIPPTRMDAERWTITLPGFAPDWSSVVLTLEGDQGPYAGWASATVRAIRACGRA